MDSNKKPLVGAELLYRADSVPAHLTAIVCTCEVTDTPGWKALDQVRPITCRKCRKMPRYLVRQCRCCHELFAKDFEHPNYTNEYPLCWGCVIDDEHNEILDKLRPIGFHDTRVSPPYFAEKLAKANRPIDEMKLLGFELRMK